MDLLCEQTFASFWRLLQLAVHRYGSSLTGEVIVVISIVLLDRRGRQPTVSDLAAITGLKKATVSRYVANQIDRGYLTEQIDPLDRRRRVLMPTDRGREELEWLLGEISGMTTCQSDSEIMGGILGRPASS